MNPELHNQLANSFENKFIFFILLLIIIFQIIFGFLILYSSEEIGSNYLKRSGFFAIVIGFLAIFILGITNLNLPGQQEKVIYGCTNAAAINYNLSATIDDGSCKYNTKNGSDNYPIKIVDTIYFDLNKFTLDNNAKAILNKIYNHLNSDEKMSLLLDGYSDVKGKSEYNLKLSKSRAEQIQNFLIKKGIEQSRISVSGSGETTSKKNPELNRRVEIFYSKN